MTSWRRSGQRRQLSGQGTRTFTSSSRQSGSLPTARKTAARKRRTRRSQPRWRQPNCASRPLAPGPPPPPLAGRLRLLPGRTPPAPCPLPPARQRTAPAGPLQHGHQRPHRLLHVRNVPDLRSELLRPDAELRSQVNPSASAGRRPCSTSATTKGRLVPHPLQLGLQRAYVVALAVPVLFVVLVAQNRDSVALSAMPDQPTTEPCSQPEA